MESLQSDLDHRAVDALLDAVDDVLNSNTFLLKVGADTPIHGGNRDEILSTFLRGRLFHEMIVDADRARGWWNLQELPAEPTVGASVLAVGAPRSLVRDGFRLTLSPLDSPGVVARLQWMLTGACNPYNRQVDDNRARNLVTQFLQYVLGAVYAPCPGEPNQPSGTGKPWEFCTIRPDFLLAEHDCTEAPYQAYYFNGCESADTATFFYRHMTFYLLLTNGAP